MTEPTDQELKRSAFKIGAPFALGGLVVMLLSGNISGSPDLTPLIFFLGVALACFGIVVLVKGQEFGKAYVEKKRSLVEDSRGIVWVWVVALATWAIMAVAYFSLSIVVYMVLDSIEAFYPFGAEELGVLSLTRNVMGWFLIIMTIGIIGWALINSARREDQTYGY